MRVPPVLLNCKIVAGAAVITMGAGTWFGPPELKAWGLLFGVLAAGLCITSAVHQGVEAIKDHLSRYAFRVFEDGFRGGVDQGREIEAAERLMTSADER